MIPDKKSSLLIMGITHQFGAAYTEMALSYGTPIAGGIAREKIDSFLSVPVFPDIKTAVQKTHATGCVVFSTPAHATRDTLEAVNAKIPLVICTAEHIPLHDVLLLKKTADKKGVVLLGPASAGLVVPDKSLVWGQIPAHLFRPGQVGIIARTSSVSYEIVQQMKAQSLGVSACIMLGSGTLTCCDFATPFRALNKDKKTKVILILGDPSGAAEEDLAGALQKMKTKKTVVVYIPGKSLAPSKRKPLIGGKTYDPGANVALKEDLLQKAGAVIVPKMTDIAKVLKQYAEK